MNELYAVEQTVEQTAEEPEKTLSMSKACSYLQVGKETMQGILSRNELKHSRNAGGHYLIPISEVQRYKKLLEFRRSSTVSVGDLKGTKTGSEQGLSEPVPAPEQTGQTRSWSSTDGLGGLAVIPKYAHKAIVKKQVKRTKKWKVKAKRAGQSKTRWKVIALISVGLLVSACVYWYWPAISRLVR